MSKIVIIGVATDGPELELINPISLQATIDSFGGKMFDTYTITGSGSGVNLTYDPFDTVTDKTNNKYLQLFNPQVANKYLTFGPLGGTGQHNLEIQYRPYLGESDLITSFNYFANQNVDPPYVIRVPGTKALLDLDGWTFRAKYSGKRYNSCIVSVVGSELKIQGVSPQYSILTYDTTDPIAMRESITKDFGLGLSPVEIIGFDASAPSGSGMLSGGDDGEINETTLQRVLEETAISSDVSVILILSNWEQDFAGFVETYCVDYQPRLMLTGVDASSSYIDTVNTIVASGWYKHNMLLAVANKAQVEINGTVKTRYLSEALALSLTTNKQYQATNNPLNIISLDVEHSEADLDYLFSAGVMAGVRKIRNGLSIYKGTTTKKDDEFFVSWLFAETWARTTPYLEGFKGKILSDGPQAVIEQELRNRLRDIPTEIIDLTVDVVQDVERPFVPTKGYGNVIFGSVMLVEVKYLVYGEILSISIGVKAR